MIDVLKSFKSLVKLEEIRTDNNVFRLHYKLTVIMLIAFSILLTSKQYFGDPIQCLVDELENKQLIETYCWIYGTYVIKNNLKDGFAGVAGLGTDRRKPYPNAKNNNSKSRPEEEEEEIIWQKYYQWICIVFCLQALFFYLPRYLWKTWEGGRLKFLVSDLNCPIVTSTWNNETKSQLVQYLLNGKYLHSLYAFKYTVCECLNFINAVSQIFFMDWLLTGQFSFYGISAVTRQEINPMTQVFPKVTKCQFYKHGPSGDLQNRDALCVLPLNILNEKLFLILWYWLFILSFLSMLSLIYRIFVFISVKMRVYLIMAEARFIGYKHALEVVSCLTYGDFFVLYHVGKNINPVIFRELVLAVHEAVIPKNPYLDNTVLNHPV